MQVMLNLQTHTLSVSFGDVKSFGLREEGRSSLEVWNKYESYDHIRIA